MKVKVHLLLILFLASCGIGDRQKAETIIGEFQKNNAPDKREAVFDIRPVFENGHLILTGETSEENLKNQLLDSLAPLEFTDEIILLPDSSVGNKTFGLINLSVANHRSEPDFRSELITQSLMGTPVKILKKKDNWYLVQTPDRYISWINPGGIQPITENQLEYWKNEKRLIFTGDFEKIYKSEKMEQPVSDVVFGNIVELEETSRRRITIKLPDGRTGFVLPENWIDFQEFGNQTQVDTTKLKNLALELNGRPYLWGGTSSKAMDCSGFTKIIYIRSGIILARDASLQAKYGKPEETTNGFQNLQIGDLLFFGKKEDENGEEKITHVAFSLGGTEFIHASGRVQENSFDPESSIYSEYRKNSFIRAKRIKGMEGTSGIILIGKHPWYFNNQANSVYR